MPLLGKDFRASVSGCSGTDLKAALKGNKISHSSSAQPCWQSSQLQLEGTNVRSVQLVPPLVRQQMGRGEGGLAGSAATCPV